MSSALVAPKKREFNAIINRSLIPCQINREKNGICMNAIRCPHSIAVRTHLNNATKAHTHTRSSHASQSSPSSSSSTDEGIEPHATTYPYRRCVKRRATDVMRQRKSKQQRTTTACLSPANKFHNQKQVGCETIRLSFFVFTSPTLLFYFYVQFLCMCVSLTIFLLLLLLLLN